MPHLHTLVYKYSFLTPQDFDHPCLKKGKIKNTKPELNCSKPCVCVCFTETGFKSYHSLLISH